MYQFPESGFVRLPQIIGDKKRGIPAFIPVSKTAWWDGIKSGIFPKPVKLGPRIAVWRADEVRKLIGNVESEA